MNEKGKVYAKVFIQYAREGRTMGNIEFENVTVDLNPTFIKISKEGLISIYQTQHMFSLTLQE